MANVMENIIWKYLLSIKGWVIGPYLHPESRTYLSWLGTSIIIGFGSYLYLEVKKGNGKWKDFLIFLLPKKIYFHPSAKMDYKIIIINIFLGPVLKIFGLISTTFLAQFTYNFLKDFYTPTWDTWEVNGFTIFMAGLLGLLVKDFNTFISHHWAHKNKYLWRLHSLHHSAEVLTPFTLKRVHPLWGVYTGLLSSAITSIFIGIFTYMTLNVDVRYFFNIQLGILIFNAAGANLRHTHIWVSYGKFLSHIFVSPAMHQIHHSYDKKHRNKNMGQIFAIWDWMFGTLYIPEKKEELKFGISKENPNPHKNLKDAFITSIING